MDLHFGSWSHFAWQPTSVKLKPALLKFPPLMDPVIAVVHLQRQAATPVVTPLSGSRLEFSS
jgi:hypothetical protein